MTATHITAPDGSLWQLVPVEPALDMVKAVYPYHHQFSPGIDLRRHWATMLAAAPEFGEVAVALVGERGSVSWRSERILTIGTPLYIRPPAADEAIVSAARAVIEARKDAHFPERCKLTDAIDELEAAMCGTAEKAGEG